jgi:hypothetical protein
VAKSNDDQSCGDRPRDVHARIEALKAKARALNAGAEVKSGLAPGFSPDMEEQFWQLVVGAETTPEVKPVEVLARSGLTFPPDCELDAASLPIRLWQLIDALADLAIYLLFTDHLSDRALYSSLVTDILQEPTALDLDSDVAWFIDFTGRGEEPDLVYLTYYADEEERRLQAEDCPDDPLPAIRPRPFDRDCRLPRPEWQNIDGAR